jgi:hypothetical protein
MRLDPTRWKSFMLFIYGPITKAVDITGYVALNGDYF